MMKSQEKCPKNNQMSQNFNNPVDLNSAKSPKSSKIARTQLNKIKQDNLNSREIFQH